MAGRSAVVVIASALALALLMDTASADASDDIAVAPASIGAECVLFAEHARHATPTEARVLTRPEAGQQSGSHRCACPRILSPRSVPLTYFGPPPSAVDPRLVGPVQLLKSGAWAGHQQCAGRRQPGKGLRERSLDSTLQGERSGSTHLTA